MATTAFVVSAYFSYVVALHGLRLLRLEQTLPVQPGGIQLLHLRLQLRIGRASSRQRLTHPQQSHREKNGNCYT